MRYIAQGVKLPIFLFAAVVLIASGAGRPAAAAGDPRAVVAAYHEQLLQAIAVTGGKTDKDRYTALAPAMDRAFDFEGMIKTIIGASWSAADDKTKAELIGAFRHVSIATHADQFAGLTAGRFEMGEARDGPRGLKMVDSILDTGSEKVPMTYVVREKGGEWRIIDVLLQGGISELALRASEYAAVLKEGGTAALIKTLNEQADDLLAD